MRIVCIYLHAVRLNRYRKYSDLCDSRGRVGFRKKCDATNTPDDDRSFRRRRERGGKSASRKKNDERTFSKMSERDDKRLRDVVVRRHSAGARRPFLLDDANEHSPAGIIKLNASRKLSSPYTRTTCTYHIYIHLYIRIYTFVLTYIYIIYVHTRI